MQTYIDSQIAKAAPADHKEQILTALIKRQQAAIDKLDPAWKSISLIGWKETPAHTRIAAIRIYMTWAFS